ncbi:MAG: FMN-binding protein [Lachnospiraceae bacterium]
MVKKYSNFIFRMLNVLIIVGALLFYNYARSNQIEKDALITQINQLTQTAQAAVNEDTGLYEDGTYEGEAKGYGGMIQVEVVVAKGNIETVTIVSAEKEDKAYLDSAVAVLDEIVETQGTEVDTVSGATFSSQGILDAVDLALEEAMKK